MTHAGFVHLRVHSAYSLAEGAMHPAEMVERCAALRMPALAMTDTNNLFGALEFASCAAAAGVQPIIGAAVTLRLEEGDGTTAGLSAHGPSLAPRHTGIVLLAKDKVGYGNLMRIVSRLHLDNADGACACRLAELEEVAEGLIALTGGAGGPVGQYLAEGRPRMAEAALLDLKRVFADRLYVELMRHGDRNREAKRIEAALCDLAMRHDLPLVASNDCHFADPAMHDAHDALLCIADGDHLTTLDRRRLTPDHCFKSAEAMAELFADLPEAVANTLVIARRCTFMPEPGPPMLPAYGKLDGRSEGELLTELATEGLEKRLESQVWHPDMDDARREEVAAPYRRRLQDELAMIARMGFNGYFLIVADFIRWTREQGIPVGPGRGSGAGSVVAWALTITGLDPLRFGLMFERFLNPERISMPDFDIDFCQDRRDEVIDYVCKTYGQDRVAQIITFGKLQARAVLRDVGRVMGMPYPVVDDLCKLVPYNPARPPTLAEAIKEQPQLQDMITQDAAFTLLMRRAQQLEGLYRHASTHAAGLVIGDRPLEQLVPLYREAGAESAMPVTQFNMKDVERIGLLKFDFLGLKTLTIIERALALVAARPDTAGEAPDIDAIPQDERAVFDMLCQGDTVGVFQLESAGMRDILKQLRPDRFEELIAVVALYRPGPMSNIPSFIKRKHGEEDVTYLHPLLEPVLEETYGIPVYQEQVMQMGQVLAGFSPGAADLLRYAMAKKVEKDMKRQRALFVAGAEKHNGIAGGEANHIFDQMASFADYGFNKSHAAAYALLAYQTAWLKSMWPVEFMAANMSLDRHSTDRLNDLRVEVARLNIPIMPPDINRSDVDFTVEYGDAAEGPALRYGLSALKNVGAGAVGVLTQARKAGGPFRSLTDFAVRVDHRALNKRMVENLVKAGAFDGLCANRRRLVMGLERLLRHGQAEQMEQKSDQQNLFLAGGDSTIGGHDDPGTDADAELLRDDVPDWSPPERLSHERKAVGFYLSAHPLSAYAERCRELGVISSHELQEMLARRGTGKQLKLAGLVTKKRKVRTQRGADMAFVTVSDASGSYEVTLFQEVLADAKKLLDSPEPLLLTVDVQRPRAGQNGDMRLTATALEKLEASSATPTTSGNSRYEGLRILLRDEVPLPHLARLMTDHGRPGGGRICLRLMECQAGTVDMELKAHYMVDKEFMRAVKAVSGILDVQTLQDGR